MAQQRRAGAHVPRFGNWDANDHAPYTKVFDTARASKGGGRLINPNDPEAFAATIVPKQQQHENPPDLARRSRASSREDGEFKKYTESPARFRQSPAPGMGMGRTPSSSDGDNNNRRQSGSDNVVNNAGLGSGLYRSPLHPQAKAVDKSGAPALPKFGDWDATDPASGEGFTTIFNNARTERQSGAGPGRIPQMSSAAAADRHHRPGSKQQSNWFCCFS